MFGNVWYDAVTTLRKGRGRELALQALGHFPFTGETLVEHAVLRT